MSLPSEGVQPRFLGCIIEKVNQRKLVKMLIGIVPILGLAACADSQLACKPNPNSLIEAKEMLGRFFKSNSYASKLIPAEMKSSGMKLYDEAKLINDCQHCVGSYHEALGGLDAGWKLLFAFEESKTLARRYYAFDIKCSEQVTVENSFSERI